MRRIARYFSDSENVEKFLLKQVYVLSVCSPLTILFLYLTGDNSIDDRGLSDYVVFSLQILLWFIVVTFSGAGIWTFLQNRRKLKDLKSK